MFVIWPPGASGCLSFLCLEVLPLLFCFYSCWQLRLFLSFDAGRCCWCSSFGALWLLHALGCLSFGGCVWCLLFGALGFLGLLLALGCLSSSLSGCGLWSVFVLWRSGALPTLKCLFCFLFAGFAPLLSLSSSWWLWFAFVLCFWSLLLVFLLWCPVASARPGVCLVWRLVSVFVDWCSGASARLGLSASFGGCDWRLSFGALGLLPARLWFGVGVCLSALWGFRMLWGVFLPFGACGWRAGASACFAVFLFPFGCCGGHLSFGTGSLLVPSTLSIFSFSSLGHLKQAGKACNDAWSVLSELVCRSAGGGMFPGCSYCCEPPQQQQSRKLCLSMGAAIFCQ